MPSLGRVNSAAGNPTQLVGSLAQAITDYDVSPDGKKLVWTALGSGGVTAFIKPLDSDGGSVSQGSGFGAVVRFANSGDGLLHSDCTDRNPSVCGLLNRLTPDPDADIRAQESDRLALAFDEAVPGQRRRARSVGAGRPAAGSAGRSSSRASSVRGSRAARRRSGRASRSRT